MRTTLGSLLVVLLLRTAHYNLAKLRDVYLHTNTLAALANLAPHMSGGWVGGRSRRAGWAGEWV